jgi:hypothetical protein
MRHSSFGQPGGRKRSAAPPLHASPDTPLDANAALSTHGSSDNLVFEWSIDAATDDIIVKPVVPRSDPVQEVLSIWDAGW